MNKAKQREIEESLLPKNKALELYNKFYTYDVHQNSIGVRKDYAKHSAKVACDEIIEELESLDMYFNVEDLMYMAGLVAYWRAIKTEIDKI